MTHLSGAGGPPPSGMDSEGARTIQCDWPLPHPVQLRGSRVALAMLRILGWRLMFRGLPAKQGMLVVYPHTSNWDFPIMLIAKWAVGIQVRFWGKDSLFRIPVLGSWMRWLGGVPVHRTSARGMVGDAVDLFRAECAADRFFWLALAPEGTRKLTPGWRSGFYRTAVGANVPLGVIRLDYARREIVVLDFIHLTGEESEDLARIGQICGDARGHRPQQAAPVRLLDATHPRSDTVVK